MRDNSLAAPAGVAGKPWRDRELTSRSPYLPGRPRGAALRRLYRRRGVRRREEIDAEQLRIVSDEVSCAAPKRLVQFLALANALALKDDQAEAGCPPIAGRPTRKEAAK
jgi:hypothetical protein